MSYLKKILDGCEEASFLALQQKEIHLPFRKRMEMKLHLMFCNCCQDFVKQSEKIDKSIHEYFHAMIEHPPFSATVDFKTKLKEKLN